MMKSFTYCMNSWCLYSIIRSSVDPGASNKESLLKSSLRCQHVCLILWILSSPLSHFLLSSYQKNYLLLVYLHLTKLFFVHVQRLWTLLHLLLFSYYDILLLHHTLLCYCLLEVSDNSLLYRRRLHLYFNFADYNLI